MMTIHNMGRPVAEMEMLLAALRDAARAVEVGDPHLGGAITALVIALEARCQIIARDGATLTCGEPTPAPFQPSIAHADAARLNGRLGGRPMKGETPQHAYARRHGARPGQPGGI